MTEFMYFVTNLFDLSLYFVLMIFFVSVLIYLVRNLRYTVLFLSSLFYGAVVAHVLKSFFNVARPLGGLVLETDSSFPSGHATIATIFFIILMYVFDDYFKGAWKWLFNIFCIVSLLLVSYSRLYLGVHWASDVLAGIILGAGISYLLVLFFRKTNFKTR